MTRTFWLEPLAGEYRHELRRYAIGGASRCTANCLGYHDASAVLGDVQRADKDAVCYDAVEPTGDEWKADRVARDDPRWPHTCAACDYRFTDSDAWQVNLLPLYEARGQVEHDGQRFTLASAPAGAMWDAEWMRYKIPNGPWTGPDGLTLTVRLPDGSDWIVDGEASNCTRTQYGPQEIEDADGVRRMHEKVWLGRTHWCWVRHGDPRTGRVTVDKNGTTCNAGAGSIQSARWHGFLTDGELRA